MAKKTKTQANTTSKKTKSSMSFVKDVRFRFTLSILLVLSAIYLFLAFVSYIFTGYSDYSKLQSSLFDVLTNKNIIVNNWTGKLGAYLANEFITSGIGICAFTIVFLMIVCAFRLLKVKLFSLKKVIFHCIFISIWLSTFLGFISSHLSSDNFFLLGGEMGYFMSKWISSVIGSVGLIFILVLSLIAYLAYTFDWFIPFLKNFASSRVKSSSKGTSNDESLIYEDNEEEENVNSVPLNDIPSNNTSSDNTSSYADSNETSHTTPEPSAPHIDEKTGKRVFKIGGSQNIEKESEQEIKNEVKEIPKAEKPVQHLFDISDNVGSDKEKDDTNDFVVEQKKEEELVTRNESDPQGNYDPTLDLSTYKLPSLDLLEPYDGNNEEVSSEELERNKDKIVNTLIDYKIEIKSIKATVGPTITLYEIIPMPGVRISKITRLQDDIALSLAALGIRIIAPMPGRGTIGIEVPNSKPEIVPMRTILSSRKYQESKYELPIALGKTISNETYVFDLAKAPHMLVAGATGQGKSVGLNAIITSLLYKKHPSQIKFILVDPKKVELNVYSKIERHFLAKMPNEDDEAIITDVQKVVNTLNSLTIEMDTRYDLLKKATVRNIKEYNHKFVNRKLNPENGHKFLPYIVVVIDEFADLIMTAGKEVEMPIARIAQLARAVGIHMIVATQRPSVNIITGVIKANFPTRVAFKVASSTDSRTILDSPGADQLIGRGDMLISQGSDLVRVQCALVDTPEVERVNDYIGEQRGYPEAFLLPEYVGESAESSGTEVDMSKRDAIFDDAARIVVENQSGSTSLIQRRFSIGYNRAGRVIDQLESAGIVGPFEGSKARQVLIPDIASLERLLESLP